MTRPYGYRVAWNGNTHRIYRVSRKQAKACADMEHVADCYIVYRDLGLARSVAERLNRNARVPSLDEECARVPSLDEECARA